MTRDTYCSHCGSAFEDSATYPRKCNNSDCGEMLWVNPVPVAVVLVPVTHAGREGLLVIRRSIEPQRGKLAIVGGFVDEGESWQAAGAREVMEETGISIDAGGLTPMWYTSTEPRPNRVLLFSTAEPIDSAAFPSFTGTTETSDRGLIFGPDGLEEAFAFGLHVAAALRYFGQRGVTGPHDFTPL